MARNDSSPMTVANLSTTDDNPPQRWLCSHLVELRFDRDLFPVQAAILEEIEATGGALGADCPYPLGAKLTIKADSFEIPAEIIWRLPRENDFLLWVGFSAGRRWDPDTWQPDHLYRLPKPKRKLRRAAGQGSGR